MTDEKSFIKIDRKELLTICMIAAAETSILFNYIQENDLPDDFNMPKAFEERVNALLDMIWKNHEGDK